MARLARVRISQELWQDWMTEGYKSGGFKCDKGLPEGAEFLYFARDDRANYGDLSMVFQHESFDNVELGNMIPEIDVWFTRLELPDWWDKEP